MEFSRNWIGRYVDLPELDKLCDALTKSGLAVEGLQERDGDVLMDLDVTTNRPDCMNHFGLAREVAVLFGLPLRPPAVELNESAERTDELLEVVLTARECPEYVARIVRGVQVGPSPDWLKEQLAAIGHRSINNVVDITNFVLWETGQPIHAFDLDKIEGDKIDVRFAREGESLKTLDGETRKLTPGVLVITDASGPIALAGIMGGFDSEVTESTRNVLIESGHFDRTAVRKGARQLGMHTDASHRFERGADPAACRPAADRVAALLQELAAGEVLAGAIENPHPDYFGSFEGTVDLGRLNRFAGVEYAPERIEGVYRALGFEPRSEDGRLLVTVPTWRYYDFWQRRSDGDVWEADLFEEPMRILGFDEIPAALPTLSDPDEGSSLEHRKRENIRELISACGFCEAINFAFQHRGADQRFPGIGAVGEPVTIANPLSEQYEVMRRSLLPNLLDSALFNTRRGATAVRIFEIGRLFPGGDAEEIEALALIDGGSGSIWDRRAEVDLFTLKGVLEGLFERFDGRLKVRAAELRGFVAGTASEVVVGEQVVGYLGEIEDDELSFPLYAVELATSALNEAELPEPVQAPSRFPSVDADLTLTHALDVPWSEISSDIAAAEVEYLAEHRLKDRYAGKGVPEGAVNTTIHFLYNAVDRSLTHDEVNERQRALTERLERRFGWRG